MDTQYNNKEQKISFEQKLSIDLDSIRDEIIQNKLNINDTIKYKFSIEGVGTEGNEGIAYYFAGNLHKVNFDIYTSFWTIHLIYLFEKDKIFVVEETIAIHEKSEQVKKISYFINEQGVPFQDVDSNRVDVFQEIKKSIPFYLK
jgi:hypothetical protein